MTDPTFTTRADLVAWAKQRLRDPDARVNALEDIKRVTLAHAHLPLMEWDRPTKERV